MIKKSKYEKIFFLHQSLLDLVSLVIKESLRIISHHIYVYIWFNDREYFIGLVSYDADIENVQLAYHISMFIEHNRYDCFYIIIIYIYFN